MRWFRQQNGAITIATIAASIAVGAIGWCHHVDCVGKVSTRARAKINLAEQNNLKLCHAIAEVLKPDVDYPIDGLRYDVEADFIQDVALRTAKVYTGLSLCTANPDHVGDLLAEFRLWETTSERRQAIIQELEAGL